MKSLDVLKVEVLADGIIDANEVKEIESVIYDDGIIDQAEADFLFDLNNAVSGKEDHEEFRAATARSYRTLKSSPASFSDLSMLDDAFSTSLIAA